MDNQTIALENIRDILSEMSVTMKSMERMLSEVVSRKYSSSDPIIIGEVKETLPENLLDRGDNANTDLYKRTVQVYYNEELERLKSNNNRKAARRVSVELGGMLCDFLNHRLLDNEIKINRMPDGLVLGHNGEDWVFAIKFITDTGFNRGDKWYEFAEGIVAHCEHKYELQKNQVFFIVASLRNGLDQRHVEKLLNRSVRSNWEFMNNRAWVKEYVEKFQDFSTFLDNPRKQIHIMTSELHPNMVADDLHKMTDDQKTAMFTQIDNYPWIMDIHELIKQLEELE